jgi:hypothetical protein
VAMASCAPPDTKRGGTSRAAECATLLMGGCGLLLVPLLGICPFNCVAVGASGRALACRQSWSQQATETPPPAGPPDGPSTAARGAALSSDRRSRPVRRSQILAVPGPALQISVPAPMPPAPAVSTQRAVTESHCRGVAGGGGGGGLGHEREGFGWSKKRGGFF